MHIPAAASSQAAFRDDSLQCAILRFNFVKLLLYYAKLVILKLIKAEIEHEC